MRSIQNKVMAVVLALAALLFASVSTEAVQYDTISYLPDGQGGFYSLCCRNDGFDLMQTDQRGESRRVLSESTPVQYFTVNGDMVTIAAKPINSYPFFVSRKGAHPEVLFLSGIDPARELIAADSHYNIYAVDGKDAKRIMKYSDTGDLLKTINTDFIIQRLFSSQSGEIYAAGNGKCMSLSGGVSVSTMIPKGYFSLCGSYVCGDDGGVYSFSSGVFTLICRCRTPVCSTASGEIYSAEGSRLYSMQPDGRKKAYLDTGAGIDRLYASGKTVAYESAGALHIADTSSMLAVPEEKPESTREESSQPAHSSAAESSDVSFSVKSDKYDLSGDSLTVAAGTTAASLRSEIEYTGCTAGFFDASGRAMASGQLGSGCSVVFSGGGTERSFTIIVSGDLTGEGNINSRDEIALCTGLTGESEITIPEAADLNDNGKTDVGDLVLLRTMLSKPTGAADSGPLVQMIMTSDAQEGAKPFYVYADISSDQASAVLAEIHYDRAALHLTSAKLTDGAGSDSFRYYDSDGTIRFLVMGGADKKSVALRFEQLVSGATGYSFSAAVDAANGRGELITCEKPHQLDIVLNAPGSSSTVSGKKESSAVQQSSSQNSKGKTDKKTSAAADDEETTNSESTKEEGDAVIKLTEPADRSESYLLIAGVILLAAAAGAVGYIIASGKRNK